MPTQTSENDCNLRLSHHLALFLDEKVGFEASRRVMKRRPNGRLMEKAVGSLEHDGVMPRQ